MKVRIDKDYCSEPVWVCDNEERFFANGDLDDFKGMLSEDLIKELQEYSDLWESVYWDHSNISAATYESFDKLFEKLTKSLAKDCKEQQPQIEWCYWSSSKGTEIYV